MTQVLSPIFEENFSEHSYGFRPGRSAHDAVKASREYFEKGYNWVVDIDLEKFFDRVNHDVLMSRVARKISDKRVLRLIRRYLESGVLLNGVQVATEEGTPQGGPMSPLLANILLDDLDKELERRGHVFCRYADDCNIYVRSERAGERVMSSIGRYLEERLKLKVNRKKSAVDRVWRRKFLGFSFYRMYGRAGIRIHPKSLKRFKETIRWATKKRNSKNFEERLSYLGLVTTGWVNYYGLADAKNTMIDLDKWICRRLRACLWYQWKKTTTKHDNLVKLGVPDAQAWKWAWSRKGYWRVAGSPVLQSTIKFSYLVDRGYKSLLEQYLVIHQK
jgi:group II intron reverse transcriptase/maturase